MSILTPVSHLCVEPSFEEVIRISDGLEIRERTLGFTHPKIIAAHIDIDITARWNNATRKYLLDILNLYTNLRLVTLQTTRVCQGEKLINGIFQLDGEIHSRDQLLSNAQTNTKWLKTNYSAQIGVENNNFYPSPAYETITDGEFLTDLCSQCEIGFLLDLAHAFVTAVNRKSNIGDYIESLPLERILQIHICQPSITGPFSAVDSHDAPSDNWLDWAVELAKTPSGVAPITIEYYQDVNTLVRTLEKLKEKI